MAKFTEAASSDKRVRALLKALRQGTYHIDLEGLEREIDSLHLTRMVRTLKTEEVIQSFQKKFITAALQNQAYRSRLVEIKVKCFRVAARLEEHIAVVRSYLGITYPNGLSKYRTVAERKQAINTVLEEPMAFLSKLELKDREIEQIVKDLDQAAWALKSIMEAMQYNRDNTTKF